MFKFLKNKIQEAVKKFSKTAKEDQVEEEVEIEQPVEQLIQEEVVQPEKIAELEEEVKEDSIEEESKAKSDSRIDEEVVEDIKEKPIIIEDELAPTSKEDQAPEIIEMKEPPKEVDELNEQVQEELEEALPEELNELAKEEAQEEGQVIKQEEELVESTSELFESPETINSQTVKEEAQEEEQVIKQEEENPLVEEKKLVEKVTQEAIEDIPLEEELQEDEIELPEEPLKEVEKKGGFFKRIFGSKKETSSEDAVKDSVIEEEALVDELAQDIADDFPSSPTKETKEDVIEEEPVSPIATQVTSEKKSSSELLDEDIEDATKKKKGFFTKLKEKVIKFQLTEEKFEEIFWDFELALLENNVALEVIEKVKTDMHNQLTKENVTRKSADQVILDTLKNSLDDVLSVESFDFIEKIKSKKPYVITMVGVNGSGKTTTLAKIIHLLQKNNLSVVVAASDTFRAAAIQQLEEHTTKLGVKLIKHDYNADPSAVAFDAISHAKAKDIDVVLIDTAGRLQSNSNLMDELKKLIRVNKPDLNIFIGESVTGNDCVEQAMAFNDAVGIDGIILSKADIDEKGGAAISVSYVTKKPILYIGTGQTYDDIRPFSKDEVLANLGL